MSVGNIDELLINYEHLWSNEIISYPGRPLRLVDIKSIVNDGKLVFVPSETHLEYCIISYVWITGKRNRASKYLLEQVSPFTVDGLISAVEVCHKLGYDYFWIDALCIDQRRKSKEKEREIPNMGKYYRDALECIIFPDGLNLNAEILPNGKLPRWFYRSWTLQEYILSRKRTFIFNSNAQNVFGYSTVGGKIKGKILNTRFGNCVCIDSCSLTWLLRIITDQWSGEAPFKADISQWKEINRESAFMMEVNCSRKGDILQRAMFRESKYEEDKIYSLLNVFNNVKIDIKYGIGLEEVLRNLAEVVTNDELAFMLLTNWFSTNQSETFSDLSALPTFQRQTAAVWFNMGKVHALCKYIRLEGVHISSKIMNCQLCIKGICTDNMYTPISTHSDLEIKEMELITSNGVVQAYGHCLYEKCDIILVVIGEFQRIDSALTGAVWSRGTKLCCLICQEKENKKLHKIGLCIGVFHDIDQDNLLHQSDVIIG